MDEMAENLVGNGIKATDRQLFEETVTCKMIGCISLRKFRAGAKCNGAYSTFLGGARGTPILIKCNLLPVVSGSLVMPSEPNTVDPLAATYVIIGLADMPNTVRYNLRASCDLFDPGRKRTWCWCFVNTTTVQHRNHLKQWEICIGGSRGSNY